MGKCGKKCEVWSRSCGYHRPVTNYNPGKREEFKDRKTYNAGQASAIVARTPPRQPDMEEAETVAVAV